MEAYVAPWDPTRNTDLLSLVAKEGWVSLCHHHPPPIGNPRNSEGSLPHGALGPVHVCPRDPTLLLQSTW